MSIIQKFDEQKRVVFVVWAETVTTEEWFGYISRLVSNQAWSRTPCLLVDLLPVRDTSSIGNAEIDRATEIFASDSKALRGKKVAVLARDEFGRARYFGDLVARLGVSLIVFNNLDTACLFLGLDLIYAYQALDEMHPHMHAS